jgi:enoyl-CoA hydratase/carnithine racemase
MQQVAVQDRVRVTIEGGVATLTMNRPEARNALTRAMAEACTLARAPTRATSR